MPSSTPANAMTEGAREFYREVLTVLHDSGVPFLVGGAYAFTNYTGIIRHTKDLDVFVHPRDHERVLDVLAAAGYATEIAAAHWLAKARRGEHFVDIIFASGNGVALIDDHWFERAVEAAVIGVPVKLCPVEEMIWSKAFIMERERYDGADVAHMLHARAHSLNWQWLIDRFGDYWRVLLGHLILFGFIYPSERSRIPAWVIGMLVEQLRAELAAPDAEERICRGPLLSRAQYLPDIEEWGYLDARVVPSGNLTQQEVAEWTEAIEREEGNATD